MDSWITTTTVERSACDQRPCVPASGSAPGVGQSYAQRPLLYHNLKNGSSNSFPPWKDRLARVSVGRGAAFGDIFNDGKIDVVVNNMDGVPLLLRNVNVDRHHWVEVKLIGGRRVRATPLEPLFI